MQLKLILPLAGTVILLSTLAYVALSSAREPEPQPGPPPVASPLADPLPAGTLRTATFALG